MRNSDMHCEGECYTHGKWEVKVQFTHMHEEPVVDECPRCEPTIGDRLEQVAAEEYETGYWEGVGDAEAGIQ